MALPDYSNFHETSAAEAQVENDIGFLKDWLLKPNEELDIKILEQHTNDPLVSAALLDIQVFYDGKTLPESSASFPLQLALATPSEQDVTPEVTAIRLLHELALVRKFNIDNYGETVAFGTSTLYRNTALESEPDFLARLDRADKHQPALQLKPTLGKALVLDVLSPLLLPPNEPASPEIKRLYQAIFIHHTRMASALFDKSDTGLWKPKLKRGIEIGNAALMKKI